nr:hypothetical protein [Candidatus Sigynarchaeota archaeon]
MTNLDLDVSEVLIEIEEANPEQSKLSEVHFYKAIDMGRDNVTLVVGKGEIDIVKKYVKELQKELQLGRINFIEKGKGGDFKSIINDFVQPGKLLGINKMFLPTGDVEYKARVLMKERDKLPMQKATLEKLIKELTDNIVRIEIENEP